MSGRARPLAKLLAVAAIAFLALWGNTVRAAPTFCNNNDVCEHEIGEYFFNCSDCADNCGDGQCRAGDGEDGTTCPLDCGPRCGDGICDPQIGEYYWTCPEDCVDHCGNGNCESEYGENWLTCLDDCHCGDGNCDAIYDENQWNCPSDCQPVCEDWCFDDWDCWYVCPGESWCFAGYCAPRP